MEPYLILRRPGPFGDKKGSHPGPWYIVKFAVDALIKWEKTVVNLRLLWQIWFSKSIYEIWVSRSNLH